MENCVLPDGVLWFVFLLMFLGRMCYVLVYLFCRLL